jgi:hypothetical protein
MARDRLAALRVCCITHGIQRWKLTVHFRLSKVPQTGSYDTTSTGRNLLTVRCAATRTPCRQRVVCARTHTHSNTTAQSASTRPRRTVPLTLLVEIACPASIVKSVPQPLPDLGVSSRFAAHRSPPSKMSCARTTTT